MLPIPGKRRSPGLRLLRHMNLECDRILHQKCRPYIEILQDSRSKFLKNKILDNASNSGPFNRTWAFNSSCKCQVHESTGLTVDPQWSHVGPT